MKTAFITGITGQDGAYLSKLLLSLGYRVIGGIRRSSTSNLWRLEELGVLSHECFELADYDSTDPSSGISILTSEFVDEVYNLAAQSFVGVSFAQPTTTLMTTGLGALSLLEAVRLCSPTTKFYQASTSEMFGDVQEVPQTEETRFYPRSPYAAAKLFAHSMTVNYREAYELFACSGILFNHESPLRGEEFVTRKISKAVASIALQQQSHLEVGNLDAKRDWGFAGDYVVGMYKMLQCKNPSDYILATNSTISIRDFLVRAFLNVELQIEWEGTGESEVGRDQRTGKILVKVNPRFYRPTEVEILQGDYSKAARDLDWQPTVLWQELCDLMVAADLARLTDGS